MKAKINGYDVECNVQEFRELIGIKFQEPEPVEKKQYPAETKRVMVSSHKAWTRAEKKVIKQYWDGTDKTIKNKILPFLPGRTVSAVYNHGLYVLHLGSLKQLRKKKVRNTNLSSALCKFRNQRARELVKIRNLSWSEALKIANSEWKEQKKIIHI